LSPETGFTPDKTNLLIKNHKIANISGELHNDSENTTNIDCTGKWIIPGFVQAHVHMAQVLFRGLGEGLTLLDWLQKKVLPLEAAHDTETLYASARLGVAELLLGGNTCMLDMGSVHHMASIFKAATSLGIGMTGGKILMDTGNGVPKVLIEDGKHSLAECEKLLDKYHMSQGGRIRYAMAPRFLLSCTDALMRTSMQMAIDNDVVWHTHVAEQIAEIDFVKQQTGRESIELIESWGGGRAKLALAHMIHLSDKERDILNNLEHPGILHCPRANTRLGSGVCHLPEFIQHDFAMGIGSDGSACNNKLDMFEEMRAAAALQDLRVGPGVLTSKDLLYMATLGGARAIGMDQEIGSIEKGKRADLLVLDPQMVPFVSLASPVDTIVHTGDARMIKSVLVNGEVVVSDGVLLTGDTAEITSEAQIAIEKLVDTAF